MIISREGTNTSQSGPPERRRYRRYPCALPIEIRPKGTGAPIRLKTSDLSAGGCYVEIAFTLAPQTPLEIVLWLGDRKLVFNGVVTTSDPQMGNGISFAHMTDDQRKQLEEFLLLTVQHQDKVGNDDSDH
jgi:c-di-GMP-binding flagellar brake protein YcgR